jgi:hypothetical protein
MSILDENGNPPAPAQGDVVAQTRQQVLEEIEKLLEIIRRLDEGDAGHRSRAAVGGVPPAVCERCHDELE